MAFRVRSAASGFHAAAHSFLVRSRSIAFHVRRQTTNTVRKMTAPQKRVEISISGYRCDGLNVSTIESPRTRNS